jgi:hypothetical protein
MKTLHTILRSELSQLERNLVRSELLSSKGIAAASFESIVGALTIEYDPATIDERRFVEILSRYGIYPSAVGSARPSSEPLDAR